MYFVYYLIVSSITAALGQMFMKMGMSGSGIEELSLNTVLKMFTTPFVDLGVLLYAISTVFWLMALSKEELATVYPFAAATYVLVLGLSWFILKEPISLLQVAGCGIVIFGLLLIVRG